MTNIIKKKRPYMTEEEKEEMSKWSNKQHTKYREWLMKEFESTIENLYIKAHGKLSNCDCCYCKSYREKTRIRMKRAIVRRSKK